jgi:hypothetical protein
MRRRDSRDGVRAQLSPSHYHAGEFGGFGTTILHRGMARRGDVLVAGCWSLIDRYINNRKSEQTRSKVAPENGTINRELALLKSAFNHGTEQTPPTVRFVPHFNMLEENNVRRGFLQDEQYLRLSRECAIEGV